jgi:nicotinate phosphoribosyltransferase
MAHSWVQMFDSEYEAFDTYCKIYPHNATLLIDTYNVLKSGVPNAIKAFQANHITQCGVRIDSGDIAYLSQKVRKMLDDAGLPDCKIVISNSLDEYIIRDLLNQGSQIDAFGVGERLITSKSDPVFGGVYKLAAIEDKQGHIIPKIKISENTAKITNPHFKKVYRIFSKESGKAEADLICLHDEQIDENSPLTIFDPIYTWKRKTFEKYELKELMVPIFSGGKKVYRCPSTSEIRSYSAGQIDHLWEEVKRFENPHTYYVDLSEKLWNIKSELLRSKSDF